ncbi:Kelch repeat-containing protein [Nevskia soli]|uniref:Kelch repeat-containing protein n=1 Tax=Nevskia soli TaxID=418856 RepID=UPI0015D85744|nr:kelch repeat-containing protein [Nevskia soli]
MSSLQAQSVQWVQQNPTTYPSQRCCPGMAFDPVDASSVLFSGSYSGGGGTSNDMWLWHKTWYFITPTSSPSARKGAGMALDIAANNIVLFGGTDSSGNPLNDTWIWNGLTWVQQFPPVSPPPRRFDAQGMVYDDATKQVVLFGGTNGSSYLGDTWSWNGVTRTWIENFPATTPSPRRTVLAFDYAAGNVVLFGGDDAAGQLGDTWIWDGVNWTELFPPASPSPRSMGAFAWDASLRRVVLSAARLTTSI